MSIESINPSAVTPLSNIIDVRGMTYTEAQPVVYAASIRLSVGQKIQVLTDSDPAAMMRAVAFQLRDAISWHMESDGKLWQVEVQPRAEAEAKDVVDLLTWDHYRLDHQFAQVLAAANENRIADAESIFQDYWIGLRRHVHLENNLLGPVLGGAKSRDPWQICFLNMTVLLCNRACSKKLLTKKTMVCCRPSAPCFPAHLRSMKTVKKPLCFPFGRRQIIVIVAVPLNILPEQKSFYRVQKIARY
ncbi:cation-binding protein [Acidithiobacillus thiooxidans ATCC 19377]|uniref:Cation-binding protein n=1 Tax=Acidithiobacillus thiooxidans ATCC 19377 TaxID=637390 RepID=A0A5P9XPH9_ACITH|nr:cation-binding protein [Acidithiobacillus thiooxidans ATCC 19377]